MIMMIMIMMITIMIIMIMNKNPGDFSGHIRDYSIRIFCVFISCLAFEGFVGDVRGLGIFLDARFLQLNDHIDYSDDSGLSY